MKLYLSNILSLSRIVLGIPLCYYIWIENYMLIILFALLGLLTDFLDGWVARKFNQVSDLGKILDPIADKVVIAMIVVVLLLKGDLPIWFVSIIVIRDVCILAGGLYMKKKTGRTPSANFLGKITLNLIALAIILVIFGVDEYSYYAILLAAFGVITSYFTYLYILIKSMK